MSLLPLPLGHGLLARSQKPYVSMVLTPAHLPDVMALQEAVLNDLGPAHSNFIVPKTAQDFMHYLQQDNGLMVGVFSEGHLIAQGLLQWPKDKSAMTDFPDWPEPLSQSAVMLGSLVHPAWRGNHLQLLLQQERLALAIQHGRPNVVGEVAAENSYSWRNALKLGAYITSTGIDETDGCKLVNYRFSDTLQPVMTAAAPVALCPFQQFDKLASMLKGQAVGTAMTADKKLVVRTHVGWQPKPAAKAKLGVYAHV